MSACSCTPSVTRRHPFLQLKLDHLRHKSGNIWHCLIPRAAAGRSALLQLGHGRAGEARLSNHSTLSTPTKSCWTPTPFPSIFRNVSAVEAAMRPGSNAGQAPLGVLMADEPAFDWSGEQRPASRIRPDHLRDAREGIHATHQQRRPGRAARHLCRRDRQDPLPASSSASRRSN